MAATASEFSTPLQLKKFKTKRGLKQEMQTNCMTRSCSRGDEDEEANERDRHEGRKRQRAEQLLNELVATRSAQRNCASGEKFLGSPPSVCRCCKHFIRTPLSIRRSSAPEMAQKQIWERSNAIREFLRGRMEVCGPMTVTRPGKSCRSAAIRNRRRSAWTRERKDSFSAGSFIRTRRNRNGVIADCWREFIGSRLTGCARKFNRSHPRNITAFFWPGSASIRNIARRSGRLAVCAGTA